MATPKEVLEKGLGSQSIGQQSLVTTQPVKKKSAGEMLDDLYNKNPNGGVLDDDTANAIFEAHGREKQKEYDDYIRAKK